MVNQYFVHMLSLVTDNKVSKKAKIRNRCNQVPHLTQDSSMEIDKNTRELHIQTSQEVSPFPADDYKAAMKGQESMTNTNINSKDYPQKKHRLGTVSTKIFLLGGGGGLNLFHGTNITVSSDVDQNT